MISKIVKLTLFTLAASILCIGQIAPPKKGYASANVWGGDHVRLQWTTHGATLDFDCAHGEITSPMPLHSNQPFKLKGTYSAEHPGPVRVGDPSSSASVFYTGIVKDGHLHLQIRNTGSGHLIGTYLLAQGESGRVMKCR